MVDTNRPLKPGSDHTLGKEHRMMPDTTPWSCLNKKPLREANCNETDNKEYLLDCWTAPCMSGRFYTEPQEQRLFVWKEVTGIRENRAFRV
jgi:hypothetical protein